MVFNAALIRRRIRSPRLCVEHLEVGETSRTDVAVCYFEGRADPELVNTVRERIAQARVDALTMNQESLAELLVRKRWYNPFPKFKFTGTAGRGGGPDPGRGCGGAGGQFPRRHHPAYHPLRRDGGGE